MFLSLIVEGKHNAMKTEGELLFVKYMKCKEPVDGIDECLWSAGSKRCTLDEDNYFESKGGEYTVP